MRWPHAVDNSPRLPDNAWPTGALAARASPGAWPIAHWGTPAHRAGLHETRSPQAPLPFQRFHLPMRAAAAGHAAKAWPKPAAARWLDAEADRFAHTNRLAVGAAWRH